jgi:hypothetical protein
LWLLLLHQRSQFDPHFGHWFWRCLAKHGSPAPANHEASKKKAKKENLKGVKNHLKELCLVSFLVTSEITIQNLKTEIPK